MTSTLASEIPLHFLIRAPFADELERLRAEGVDAHWETFSEGPEAWSLQTYLHAFRSGWNVTAGTELLRGAINLAHVATLNAFQSRPEDLIVGIRADYRPSLFADCQVVQNHMQSGHRSFWIPHWSQPGIIPRSVLRTGFIRAAYFGREYYLQGGHHRWRDSLQRFGISFDCPPAHLWNDYSQVDLIIAIRSFDAYPYPRKPPTKLLNAWIAGVPALVGPESAYTQIGQAGRDYLVAHTFEEALDHVARLQADQALYTALVESGFQRAQEFTREKTLAVWEELISTQLVPLWDQFRRPSLTRRFHWLCRNTVGGLRAFGVHATRCLFGNRPLSR